MKTSDCVIRIAGEGGEGVISCGEILTQAFARAGYHVMSWKTFPSEIRGGLARFQFRVKSEPVPSLGSNVNIIMAFNQEAMNDCCNDASCSARVVIYDPELVETSGCAAVPGSRYPLPLNKICKEATGELRAKNVVALGAIAQLLDLDYDGCLKIVTETWESKGPLVVEKNQKALEAGYQQMGDALNPEDQISIPKPKQTGRRLLLMSGNDAVALGAIVGGCRFAAGYPITPATSVFEYLCRHLPRFSGGRTVQTEDEIAALASCIGASFAGCKAMTPTSGPGLSLMSELIGLASMLETPVVIVDVQRGGPSTGLPTKTEQSDLNLAVFGTHGDAPRLVIAPASIEECFYQTIRAFNLAEQYQMPVIVLTDASLAFREKTIEEPDLDAVQVVDRAQPTRQEIEAGYLRYRDTEDGVSPMATPGTPGAAHIVASLEHLETGAPNYSPEIHTRMTAKRFRKLETARKNLEADAGEIAASRGARIGVIGWGSTYGAIQEARQRLASEGVKVSHFHPRVLWPLPDAHVRRFIKPLEKVIVVEENFAGQLACLLRERYLIEPVKVTKCEGIPFTSDEVYNAVMERAKRA